MIAGVLRKPKGAERAALVPEAVLKLKGKSKSRVGPGTSSGSRIQSIKMRAKMAAGATTLCQGSQAVTEAETELSLGA